MSYSPRVTDEEVADMLRLRKEGHTQKEIAEWIGCAERTVGFHLRLNGMPRQRIWTDTAVKHLLELARQGISMTEIARQMGMTYKSVTMELFSPSVRKRRTYGHCATTLSITLKNIADVEVRKEQPPVD